MFIVAVAHTSSDSNVMDKGLAKCSGENEAVTGFTRTGFCDDQKGDEGSHHICIDLHTEPNFCETTKQDNVNHTVFLWKSYLLY